MLSLQETNSFVYCKHNWACSLTDLKTRECIFSIVFAVVQICSICALNNYNHFLQTNEQSEIIFFSFYVMLCQQVLFKIHFQQDIDQCFLYYKQTKLFYVTF